MQRRATSSLKAILGRDARTPPVHAVVVEPLHVVQTKRVVPDVASHCLRPPPGTRGRDQHPAEGEGLAPWVPPKPQAGVRGHELVVGKLPSGMILSYVHRLPSGRFPANGAWLAEQVMAHNLARWITRIGLGEPAVTTKTLRRRFFSLAGRLTRKARRLTLHLP